MTDEERLAEARAILANTNRGFGPKIGGLDIVAQAIAAALAKRDVEIERLHSEQTLYEARVEAATRNERREAICEGRRQMREEAARLALTYRDGIQHPADADDISHVLGQGYAANYIAKRIRALPDNPPTQEPPQ